MIASRAFVVDMIAPKETLPRHVAIVMDGNGRWASRRFLPRIAGHKRGVDALKRVLRACVGRGIGVLTVFAFSSENWKRPVDEVSGLMDILVSALSMELSQLRQLGVQLHFIGERTGLSARVLRALEDAEASTATNSTLVLNVCFNYGGRWDIVHAVQVLQARGEVVTQDSLGAALTGPLQCEPDLIIRTGGEMRLSNFLLWQAAYSELYFSELLWPDFDADALDVALAAFASRERRFGSVAPQVAQDAAAV